MHTNKSVMAGQDGAMISIQLAYAPTPDTMRLQTMQVPSNATVLEALQSSGWLDEYTELGAWCRDQMDRGDGEPNPREWRVGIFAKKCSLSQPLKAGDRIEIYRPLLIDPMQKRKLKAKRREGS